MFDLHFLVSFITIIFFFFLVILYILSLKNSIKYKVPQVSTFNCDIKLLKKCLSGYDLKGKKIVDLGCGIGKILRFFEKNFACKSFGYEIDLSNVIIGKIINKILKSNSKIINLNYFDVSLKEYDYIYIYLFPSLIEKIEEKIFLESKKGTIIIVNAFKFKKHIPINIYNNEKGKQKLFIYKI